MSRRGTLQKIWAYINYQNPRPRLVKSYWRPGDDRYTDDAYIRLIIAQRKARTPDQARALIDQHGLQNVLRMRSPQRKKPPRLRRLRTLIRRMFP